MDTLPLSTVSALDAVEALSAAGGSGEAGTAAGAAARPPDGTSRLLLRESLAERLLGPAPAASPQDPSGALPAAAHPAAETAVQQGFMRPPPAPGDAPTPQQRLEASAPATADSVPGEFALPEALLAPALMVGLQVDPGMGWTLPPPLPEAPRLRPGEADKEREPDPRRQRQESGPGTDAPTPDDGPGAQDGRASTELVFDAVDAADSRLDALLRALHAALRGANPPPALRAAAEQWRRGRCVVVACPQAPAPQGAAWAFVLAPGPAANGAAARLAGPCFEAGLQWREPPREPPRAARWCHARLVKEHHPRHGRRLVAADAAQAGDCAVQLGPVLAERRAPCAVTLRIAAARSFWNALGMQWSVLLVVCPLPLAGPAPAPAPA
ncbi:hypothetical protein [Azohydromonas aeria]|uniref:hypothetical protein n=1 Tax=Azohydromonas aeria TaxID=2590212 RepID=UPI0012F72085|nr:hypothetical protein [Azohydromonas aeria]